MSAHCGVLWTDGSSRYPDDMDDHECFRATPAHTHRRHVCKCGAEMIEDAA